jgi:hypothetical protein
MGDKGGRKFVLARAGIHFVLKCEQVRMPGVGLVARVRVTDSTSYKLALAK